MVYGSVLDRSWFCHKKDKKLTSNTSIWMFPIYATAIIIEPIGTRMKNRHCAVMQRGFVYAMCIFITEFLTGSLLKNGCCPWDYSKAKLNIKGVIRLDYFPVWFIAGLFTKTFSVKMKSSDKGLKKPCLTEFTYRINRVD